MAAIVWADLVARVASLASVDVGVQADLLADVNTKLDIRVFDLGEADPQLRLARIYLALHHACGDADAGIGSGYCSPAGPMTQESAGGVMRQYVSLGADGAPMLAESYWGRRYLQIMRSKRFGTVTL